jgi:hypothetical protein
MTDSGAGLTSSPDTSVYAKMMSTGADGLPAQGSDNYALSQSGGLSDTSAPTAALQDQFHDYMQGKFGNDRAGTGSKEPVLMAMGGGTDSSTSSSALGSVMNYAGYITYISLAASAFGHDDPFQLETRATRFFQEKILHHHAIDNPQVWAAMGDAVMTEQHLALQGAHFKPLKLKTINGEVKHESAEEKLQGKAMEHDAKNAQDIIKDITSGLKSPADYVLAAKFLYSEAVEKADARATKEATDHKDEKRLLGRLNLLSGETDRTDAMGARDNSVDPLLDDLGARVSLRLDEAALLERYGSHVPELGWDKEAADLRTQAKTIFDDPNALSEPVRNRLHQKYADVLSNNPLPPVVLQHPAPVSQSSATG